MKYVADLHLHSRYSRATSKASDLPGFYRGALLKGITVVGSSDFTHPAWFAEILEQLVEAEEGLFTLRPDLARAVEQEVPPSCHRPVRFLLSVEISSIYKKNGKTRKVHNVVFAPDLASAGRIRDALDRIGNIRSDGRPILGLDSKDLLEIVLEASEDAHLIPAHIWTPWFSALGSKSGFDTIEECYEELTDHIFAVETGLSSDPPMNWTVSSLDRFTLVSNSDSHSIAKMGRESNLFDTALSYPALFQALRTRKGFLGTLEFFPEEGKYHLDGHRKCDVRLTPEETIKNRGLCPVCGKKVTVGVLSRVAELADRPPGSRPTDAAPFYSLIPLSEVVGEILGRGPATKGVARIVDSLVEQVGPELDILLKTPPEDLEALGRPLVAEAVRRMRAGRIHVEGGYDGEYGRIRVFEPDEIEALRGQHTLFSLPRTLPAVPTRTRPAAEAPDRMPGALFTRQGSSKPRARGSDILEGLDEEQRAAAAWPGTPLLIVAGPGTGKTRTLTHRIAHRIGSGEVKATKVLAVTFTRRASKEMKERLSALLKKKKAAKTTVLTFHALALDLLRRHAGRWERSERFSVLSDEDSEVLFQSLSDQFPDLSARQLTGLRSEVSRCKRELLGPDSPGLEGDLAEVYAAYEKALDAADALDFDDLLFTAVLLLRHDDALLRSVRRRFKSISVDEFQDLNHAQFTLLTLLAPPDGDVCAIGDPDQAIYGFRGSDPEIFDRFRSCFEKVKTLRLTRTYRLPEAVANASWDVLAAEARREGQPLLSQASGLLVHRAETATDRAEAEFVTHAVERLVGGAAHFSLDSGRVEASDSEAGLSFGDVAVLARMDTLLGPVAEAMDRAGFPYFRPGAAPSLKRPGLRKALLELRKVRKSIRGTALCPPGLTAVQERLPHLSIPEEDKNLLLETAHRVEGTLDDLLDYMVLGGEDPGVDPRGDRIALLTLHASKGLEFPAVFLIGCEAGILPLDLAGSRKSDPEEERRLFYVGMTRARDQLFLTRAQRRSLFGKTLPGTPSPFLLDIGSEHLKEASLAEGKKIRNTGEQLTLF